VPAVRRTGDQLRRWRRQRHRFPPPPGDHHHPLGGGEHLAGDMPGVEFDVGQGGVADPVHQLRHPFRFRPDLPHPYDHVRHRPPIGKPAAAHRSGGPTPYRPRPGERGDHRPVRLTVSTGSAESAGRSSRLAGTPAATRWLPSAATIAPLSVHSRGRGTRRVRPAAAHRCSARARSRLLAATPPPITRVDTPYARQAATAFMVSTSATDSWKLAATSATGTGSPARCRASTHRATAVFSPENEKSYGCAARSLGAVSPRGNATKSGSPSEAARSIGGPPGNGSPSNRATLSNASPAASSMVAPSGVIRPARSSTSSSDVCPPETSNATAGSGNGPCSSVSTATWAARWFTPYTGLSNATAYPLAAATPTSSAPASPGPAVTAIASTSASRTPASSNA